MDGDIFAHSHRSGTWADKYTRRLLGLDFLVGGLVVTLALIIGPASADVGRGYILASLAMPIVWVLTLAMSRAYERRYLGVSDEEYRAVGRATIMLLGLLAVAGLFVKVQWSRMYVITLIVGLFLLGVLVRRLMRHWLHHNRRSGVLMQRTVVVGRADAVAELIRNIKSSPDQGMEPVAVCTSAMDSNWNSTTDIDGVPVLGTPLEAISAVDLCDAEVVVVTSHPELVGKQLRRLAWALEERGVELVVSTGLLDVAGPRLSIRQSTDMSLLHIERPAATRRSVILKSLMDRTLAFFLILGLSPLLIAIAIAIKVTDPGPVIFKQKRVGVRGDMFTIFKFRTMCVDAEKKLESLLHMSEGNSVQFKLKRDPRITGIGHFLRKYSLDELPQLFNVLFGTMSLVGPRPQSQAEVEQYEPDAMRRLHVRPGMTGLWQISGRSDLDWEQSIRLDLRYVDNWSPIVDLQILFRTFRAVVAGSGAY
ncbi:putative glycosyltransferase [Kineosphaera limosa NBRC 100340]|uniref:Putative glycosyltransferase n=2 Tax=Kineosphaera TaxID=211469 RepID=K6VDS3_9MICO|nr:putative glycosyltransferase [Kineosphaera limosa NBRC 100340]